MILSSNFISLTSSFSSFSGSAGQQQATQLKIRDRMKNSQPRMNETNMQTAESIIPDIFFTMSLSVALTENDHTHNIVDNT
jgi:hypothetical protein